MYGGVNFYDLIISLHIGTSFLTIIIWPIAFMNSESKFGTKYSTKYLERCLTILSPMYMLVSVFLGVRLSRTGPYDKLKLAFNNNIAQSVFVN